VPKKASVLCKEHRGRIDSAVPPRFTVPSGTVSGYFHILCAVSGAPGFPISLPGFRLPLRRVFRICRPGRLAPPGGSLDGYPAVLLDLLHRTAILLRSPRHVKPLNSERTIPCPGRRHPARRRKPEKIQIFRAA